MKSQLFTFAFLMASLFSFGQNQHEKDIIKTKSGNIQITFLGHASLIIEYGNKTIYIDPVSQYADYKTMPKADIIIITHHHQDHFDPKAISDIEQSQTQIITNQTVFESLKKGIIMKNNSKKTIDGFTIEAIAAYNTTPSKLAYHPKGRDNGFIINIGGKRIYIAGDTENIPEMSLLKHIDIAFLPMNQPYTMSPEQVAEAAHRIQPSILYPYHYGETPIAELQKRLINEKHIDLRVRKMQ